MPTSLRQSGDELQQNDAKRPNVCGVGGGHAQQGLGCLAHDAFSTCPARRICNQLMQGGLWQWDIVSICTACTTSLEQTPVLMHQHVSRKSADHAQCMPSSHDWHHNVAYFLQVALLKKQLLVFMTSCMICRLYATSITSNVVTLMRPEHLGNCSRPGTASSACLPSHVCSGCLPATQMCRLAMCCSSECR